MSKVNGRSHLRMLYDEEGRNVYILGLCISRVRDALIQVIQGSKDSYRLWTNTRMGRDRHTRLLLRGTDTFAQGLYFEMKEGRKHLFQGLDSLLMDGHY